ncbi:MAG TPA: hypothetical protein VFZ78_08865, partial [Flavisolibacter sp.]
KSIQLEDTFNKQTDKYLKRLQRHEERIKRKLDKKDTELANRLFGDVSKRYANLRSTINTYNSQAVYSPKLDSLITSLNYLDAEGQNVNAAELKKTLDQYKLNQQNIHGAPFFVDFS